MHITKLLFLILFCSVLGSLSLESNENEEWDLQTSWIVSPRQAKAILNLSGTVLFDPRNSFRRFRYSLPESIPINWKDWSEPNSPHKGKILSKERGVSILSKYNLK